MRVRMYKYDDRLKIEELELLSIVINVEVVGWLPYDWQSSNFVKYTRSMTFVFIHVKLRMLVTIVKNANQKKILLACQRNSNNRGKKWER